MAKNDERKELLHDVKRHTAAGAGGVAAGVGLAAGGIPGAKSDFSSVFRVKPGEGKGVKRAASTVRGAAPAAKAVPGGILGFRLSAHKGGNYGFKEQAKADAKKGPATSSKDAFYRGYNAGKIGPEEKIIRGMTKGRVAANLTMLGGAGSAAYGLSQPKDRVKKSQKDTDKYHATLAGAGGAGAATSHYGSKYLKGQEKKFERSATRKVDEAGKIAPAMAGRKGQKMNLRQMHKYRQKNGPDAPWPKTMYPKVSDGAPGRHPEMLAGVSPKDAQRVGQLRGAAAQERHFAEVFGNTSKVVRRFRTPSAIVGAAGAGGLAVNHVKVKKDSTSAFGVDHAVSE